MNNLVRTLLGSVALAALAYAPAAASELNGLHVTAMHDGKQVNKTKALKPCSPLVHHCDYTFGVYTYQPASAPRKTPLAQTFYKWSNSGDICTAPKMKIKAPRKSIYAKIGTASRTYSLGCSNGPTKFLGDLWTNKTGVAGEVDQFESRLMGWITNRGAQYKVELDLDVQVFIQ